MPAQPYKIAVAAAYPPIARFVALTLKLAGFRPHVLVDGEEALKYLLSEQVDAAVLDAALTKVDGFAICQRIRAVSSVPIVLLALRDEGSMQARARQVGANACLLLPCSVEDLLSCVRPLLSAHDTARADGHGEP